MTDKYPGLFDGAIDERAYVINAIADEQITIGSPVILVAPAAGELLPRVEPTAVQGARIYGVVVGGDSNGTYGGASEIAAEAGEAVKVCVNGRCKARVDGVIRAIAIGDPLTASGTDGVHEPPGQKPEAGKAPRSAHPNSRVSGTGYEHRRVYLLAGKR